MEEVYEATGSQTTQRRAQLLRFEHIEVKEQGFEHEHQYVVLVVAPRGRTHVTNCSDACGEMG